MREYRTLGRNVAAPGARMAPQAWLVACLALSLAFGLSSAQAAAGAAHAPASVNLRDLPTMEMPHQDVDACADILLRLGRSAHMEVLRKDEQAVVWDKVIDSHKGVYQAVLFTLSPLPSGGTMVIADAMQVDTTSQAVVELPGMDADLRKMLYSLSVSGKP